MSWRVARRLSAWALPRASASASAKLAKRTVSSSRIASDDLVDDQAGGCAGGDRLDRDDRRQDPADLDQEHDGVLRHDAGSSITNDCLAAIFTRAGSKSLSRRVCRRWSFSAWTSVGVRSGPRCGVRGSSRRFVEYRSRSSDVLRRVEC